MALLDYDVVHGSDLAEKAWEVPVDVFRTKGFGWLHPGSSYLFLTSLEPVADLIEPRERRPLVRVFKSRSAEPPPNELQEARAAARAASIPLIALTPDGRHFRTMLTTGNGGSLPYLPSAPQESNGRSRAIRRIEDTFPFTSILELRKIVARIADNLFTTSGGDRLQLFDTTLTLLAMKFFDELQHPDSLRLPGILQTSRPSEALRAFHRRALRHFGVGSFVPEARLNDAATISALRALLPYSLIQTIQLGSEAEILAAFYQDTVSSTFRGSLGAYFTPKPIADLAVALCEPRPNDTVFDISCGSGTFLLSAYSAARAGSKEVKQTGPSVFGCDIQPRMVLASVLNSLVHGVSNPRIVHGDGLRLSLEKWSRRDKGVPKKGFSLIVGNPPFAGFDLEASSSIVDPKTKRVSGARVHKVIPFIDRVLELLAPGGRAALVIPTSVLNGEATSFRGLRDRLAKRAQVTAIVGLPKEAFVHTDCGVEGALLFFRKAANEVEQRDSKTFFTRASYVGYDRRGRATSTSDLPPIAQEWRARDVKSLHWISTKSLAELDRWDPAWLEAHVRDSLAFDEVTHVCLTELCDVVDRAFSRRRVSPDADYVYFEVGDTDLDTGKIRRTHQCSGTEILRKGRLRLRLEGGEVLLPNHRDSLIAKTASAGGRSAVVVPPSLKGTITSDRFTPLKSNIDPRVLVVVLNSGMVRQQLVLRSRGSASFDIRDKVLREIWVPREIINDSTLRNSAIELWSRREALLSELDEVATQLQQIFTERDTAPRARAKPPWPKPLESGYPPS